MIKLWKGFLYLGISLTVVLIAGCPSGPNLLMVNSLYDVMDGDTSSVEALQDTPGEGRLISLREAITAVNNTPGEQRIRFSVSGEIKPLTALPEITDTTGPIDIDGENKITIVGDNIFNKREKLYGLKILSPYNIIRGLSIYNFSDGCINIYGANAIYNTVQGCSLGDPNFTESNFKVYGPGITIEAGARHNLIGGDTVEARNIISGNGNHGVLILDYGTNNNTIQGNYIGVADDGVTPLLNWGSGIYVMQNADGNLIKDNVISGNDNFGISCEESTDTVIQGNFVGTDETGSIAIPNQYSGIFIREGSSYTQIGGVIEDEGNIISGNLNHGIEIYTSDFNLIQGNLIGVDSTATAPLPNAESGIFLGLYSSNNTIGGEQETASNIIAANGLYGVHFLSYQMYEGAAYLNTVQGNYIGLESEGMGNAMDGILLEGALQNTLVGGVAPYARNIITSNGMYGIHIFSDRAIGNELRENFFSDNEFGPVKLEAGANGSIAIPDIRVRSQHRVSVYEPDNVFAVEYYVVGNDGSFAYYDTSYAPTMLPASLAWNGFDSTLSYFVAATDMYGNTSEFGELQINSR